MNPVFSDRRYLIPFRAKLLPQIFTDVLVIGGGVAGLRAALSAHGGEASDGGEPADVIVLAKGELKESNTFWAQGGVAVVMDDRDSVADHVRDTMVAGADLCDRPAVRSVVEAGPERVQELLDWGMPFDAAASVSEDQGLNAEPALGREGGHSHHRILHTDGDATGRALGHTLGQRVRDTPGIRFFEQCFVLDLITEDGPDGEPLACVGAITHHEKYGLQVIWAHSTVLASGGAGEVYRESTNPHVATGDGLAMAYRAGAAIQDLAFFQFHPTTLYIAGASRSLITEAVRGEGAYLIDRAGHRFMPDYDERAELAPRDIVSRSILAQMAKTGHTHVYLDVRHLEADAPGFFARRFPGIEAMLKKFDIDPTRELIPVHPSAHYYVGGVRVDGDGRCSIPGLYAAGEVTASGLHGANRLASNSLLEGLVFGQRAGAAARERLDGATVRPRRVISDIRPSERSELDLADVRSSLRSVMWRHVGIEREGAHLDEVAEMFRFWGRYTMDKIFDDRAGWEVQNLLTVGALITRAARWREETRGTHARLDFPEPREAFRVHEVWLRSSDEPVTHPVVDDAAG